MRGRRQFGSSRREPGLARAREHRRREGQVVGGVRRHGPRVGAWLAGRRRAVPEGARVGDGGAQARRAPRHHLAHARRRLHLGVRRSRPHRRARPRRVRPGARHAGRRRLGPAHPRRGHLRHDPRLGARRRVRRRRRRPGAAHPRRHHRPRRPRRAKACHPRRFNSLVGGRCSQTRYRYTTANVANNTPRR